MFSPDGKLIASVSLDNTVWLWDLSTGAVIHTCRAWRHFNFFSFSPNGPYLEADGMFLDYLPAPFNTYSPHHPAKVRISLQGRWIVGTMGNLLWLPSDYKLHCSDVQNTSIV